MRGGRAADLPVHRITITAYPITCRAGGIGGSGIFGGDLTGFSSLLIFGPSPTMVNEEQLETTATILHADLDAFYASVEQLLDPSLRGSPIAVGGGVVPAASYEARAKIASQAAKPDGLVVVDPGTELDFLHDLPVELMWGVGPVSKARLADIGVCTIGQLARTPGQSLTQLLGPAAGEKLAALAWNRDPREIRTHRRAASAGAQSALGSKPAEERVFRPTLRHLADRICSRLRARSRPGRTVTVRVRFAALRSVSRSVTLGAPISTAAILAEIAEGLVRTVLAQHPDEKTISLLAISVSNLEEHPELQLEFPLGLADEQRRPGSESGMARWAADRAVDAIRDRFGWDAVGYGSVALGIFRSVPDAFRELAEKDL
jgi:DNA polymerase IV